MYQHGEADVKIIRYVFKICPHHKHVQILANDADIYMYCWYTVNGIINHLHIFQ